MNLKSLINRIKPPCKKCPYKLGRVQFVENPCPQCKMNNYQTYHMLISGSDIEVENE